MAMGTKGEMLEFVKCNMEPLLDKFKGIKGLRSQNHYSEDDWVLFSAYAIRKLLKEKLRGGLPINFENIEYITEELRRDELIGFLMDWLNNVDGYNLKEGNTEKDRKNSFFRLVARHLKKTYKEPTSEKREALKDLQERLNKNTVSNNIL